jgi:tetratricopeptide (TPR) repeat protein
VAGDYGGARGAEVLIGVDPHKATHAVAAIDGSGELLEQASFSSGRQGSRALRSWASMSSSKCEARDGCRVSKGRARSTLLPSSRKEQTMQGTQPSAARDGAGSAKPLEQAKRLYKKGKLAESEAALRQAMASGTDTAEAHYLLGLIRFKENDLGAAAASFADVLRRDPQHANALYMLGAMADQRNRWQEARDLYLRTLDADPQHVGARKQLERLLPPIQGTAVEDARAHHASVDKTHRHATTQQNHGTTMSDASSRYGAYEFLTRDGSALSKPTIEAMDALTIDVRPNFVAHVGKHLGRVLTVLPVVLVVPVLLSIVVHTAASFFSIYLWQSVAYQLQLLGIPVPYVAPSLNGGLWISTVVTFFLAAVIIGALVALAVGYVKVVTTRIVIERGRLQLHKGVFARHVRNVELWRVQNVDLEKSFFNRLTGDGTLVVSLIGDQDVEPPSARVGVLRKVFSRTQRKHDNSPLKLTGVARGRRLDDLHRQMLNLVFLLRGHQVVKGIIQ